MSTVWLELLGAEVRWYDAGGVRTRCIEAGEGPALILLHGVGGHAEAFARNVVPLARRFRVMAIDYLGFGLTDKPAQPADRDAYVAHLVALMDAAGVDQAHLAGESLGGWISMWTALLHPDRVDRLISVCGARLEVETDDASRQHVRDGLAELRQLTKAFVAAPSRDAVRRRMEWLFHDPQASLTEELVDIRWRLYQETEAARVLADASQRTSDLPAGETNGLTPVELGKIQQPTLMLWTSDNPTTTAATARRAAQHIPDCRFELMERCGHWPQWEDPATFNRIVTDFLASP
jgi:pimeloyl-ACP methyl ester carboxylesterase